MNDHRDSQAQLLSLAVHELRTPVSVVSGYLRMLLRHFGDTLTDQQRTLLQESEKSCASLAGLLAELSELSQIAAGRLTLRCDAIPILALLRQVAESVHEAEDRGVRLEVRGDGSDAVVQGDRERLASALASLMAATLRERADAGVVVAAAAVVRGAERAEVVIALADGDDAERLAADGLPPDAQPFDEYRGGLGFRLPIAARVVAAHGGRVASPVVARGRLTIVLSLPAAPGPEKTS